MSLFLRCLIVFIRSRFKKPLGILGESILKCWVLPNDLDFYGHMNNGRFLTVMDLGRIDLIFRMGLREVTKKKGWGPVVGSSWMRHRSPLRLFDRYDLVTRIICWDTKWIFLEQQFVCDEKVLAWGIIKGLFVGRDGAVPTEEVLQALGVKEVSPEMPDYITQWVKSEELSSEKIY